jgi:hypothetical protein
MEPHSLRHAVEAARARFGRIDVGYYGPADFGTPTGAEAVVNALAG